MTQCLKLIRLLHLPDKYNGYLVSSSYCPHSFSSASFISYCKSHTLKCIIFVSILIANAVYCSLCLFRWDPVLYTCVFWSLPHTFNIRKCFIWSDEFFSLSEYRPVWIIIKKKSFLPELHQWFHRGNSLHPGCRFCLSYQLLQHWTLHTRTTPDPSTHRSLDKNCRPG